MENNEQTRLLGYDTEATTPWRKHENPWKRILARVSILVYKCSSSVLSNILSMADKSPLTVAPIARASSSGVNHILVVRVIIKDPPLRWLFEFFDAFGWHALFFFAQLSMGFAMVVIDIHERFSLGLLMGTLAVGCVWAVWAVLEF